MMAAFVTEQEAEIARVNVCDETRVGGGNDRKELKLNFPNSDQPQHFPHKSSCLSVCPSVVFFCLTIC
jgi:hypothetical protein